MGKPKKQKQKKNLVKDKTYNLLLNKLDSFQNTQQALSWMKNSMPTDHIGKYLPKIVQHYKYKTLITKNLFPINIMGLGRHNRLVMSEYIVTEITWFNTLLNIYSSEINIFLDLRQRYNYALLKGDYNKCCDILDELENKLGFSLWLIENRINLYSVFNKKDELSNYIITIFNSDVDQMTLYLSHIYYYRSDVNLSFLNFRNSLIQEYENIPRQIYEYFMYKICYINNMEIYNVNEIFWYESGFSLIDVYLTSTNIYKHLYTVDNADCKTMMSEILKHCTIFRDDSLETLLRLYEIKSEYNQTQYYAQISDDFYCGKFEKALETCEKAIIDDKYNMEIIFFILNAFAFEKNYKLDCLPSGSLLTQIITSSINIIRKENNSIDSYHSLLKIISLFSNETWAIQLLFLVNKEFNTYGKNYCPIISTLSFNWDSVFILDVVPSELKNNLIIDINRETSLYFSTLSAVDMNATNVIEGGALYYFIKNLLIAKIYTNQSKYDEIILLFHKDLTLSKNEYLYFNAVRQSVNSYISLNKLEKALTIITDCCLKYNYAINIFDIGSLILELKENELSNSFKAKIDYPIFSFLINNYSIDSFNIRISIAYEEFLELNNVTTPTKLLEHHKCFEQSKFMFFLKNICVQSIMDDSIYFSSSDEIERERINICQWLAFENNDEDNFSEEIKSITQRLLINNLMRKIESSKISVDVDSIKNNNMVLFRELYETFKGNLEVESELLTLKCLLSDYLREETTLILLQPLGLKAFVSYFKKLKEEFLFNDKLGLDTCLSIRIRHGTLTGQLRSNLVNNNLITQMGENNEYKKNEYWLSKIQEEFPDLDVEILSNYLLEFAKSIDDLIGELKNKWIQISDSENQSDALFNYYIPDMEISMLYENARKVVSYEEFVDLGINYLWQLTEKNLSNVRSKIRGELNSRFSNIFYRIETQLALLPNGTSVSELKSKFASSRTDMQYELDKISNWFKLEKINEMQDFHIQSVHDIAFEMLTNVYADKAITQNFIDTTNTMFEGKLQKCFVDMLYILFDNVVKHSNFDSEIHIETEVSCNQEYCILTVRNKLGEGLDIDSLILKLNKIKEKISNNSSLTDVRREGGTGLYKINKILTADIGGKSKFNCYVNEREYSIQIFIDIEVNVIEDSNN